MVPTDIILYMIRKECGVPIEHARRHRPAGVSPLPPGQEASEVTDPERDCVWCPGTPQIRRRSDVGFRRRLPVVEPVMTRVHRHLTGLRAVESERYPRQKFEPVKFQRPELRRSHHVRTEPVDPVSATDGHRAVQQLYVPRRKLIDTSAVVPLSCRHKRFPEEGSVLSYRFRRQFKCLRNRPLIHPVSVEG